MDKARIAELLGPFLSSDLSDGQLDNISIYIDILIRWNQRINLTAVRNPEEMVTRHFGESLFAAQYLFPASAHVGAGALTRPAERSSAPETRTCDAATDNALSVVDVGSGAGFPGLPIKIWSPDIQLTLIESNHKKATFLKEVARTLGLGGVEVFTGRAESFPAAAADIVTLRAVEQFEKILPVAAGLVRPGGRLALLIGSQQIERAKNVARRIDWQAALPIPLASSRVLLLAHK
jgi:16S rRNA (guanine527-N7)-methyltransferase